MNVSPLLDESRHASQAPAHRLAFVNGGLGPGGATTFLCNLAGELVRRSIPAVVMGLERENALANDFQTLQVPVVTQDERRDIFEDRLVASLQFLTEFQPSAVMACLGPDSYELLRYIPRGVTRVLMVQADHAIHYEGAAPYGAFVDAVVGVSEQIRQTLAGMPQFKHVPSYNLTCGVAVPPEFRPRRIAPGDPLRLVYLGRLERQQKRVDLFPQILQQLVQSQLPFVWSIVGEGPDADFLAQTMKTTRPDQQVRLLGSVSYQKIPDILEEHDVLLLASRAEGLPLCVLEAMAHGLVPVVTRLSSGIRELINGSNGRAIAADDLPGYAEAILELYRRPEMMEQLSLNARATIEREYSVGVMADRWLDAFPPKAVRVEWPRKWEMHAPLGVGPPIKFSAPGRALRRVMLRLRS